MGVIYQLTHASLACGSHRDLPGVLFDSGATTCFDGAPRVPTASGSKLEPRLDIAALSVSDVLTRTGRSKARSFLASARVAASAFGRQPPIIRLRQSEFYSRFMGHTPAG